MKNKRFVVRLLLVFLISSSIWSCVPISKIKYLQDKEGEAPVTVFEKLKPDYKLMPGDYLMIRILSPDEKINMLFANITGGTNGFSNITDESLYVSSYLVNDSGYVSFPLLGNIYAEGLTVSEMEKNVNKAAKEIITESSVVVKLVLYNISILGEVKVPGKYTIYNNRVNIFEALAMAGDLSPFADRSHVQIIRNEGRKSTVLTIDLLKKDVLTSPYYYIQPNDIIYISPMKMKTYGFDAFPYALVFSTVTTALLIATYLK
jgi:polysaccharide biosynthesis/export protein